MQRIFNRTCILLLLALTSCSPKYSRFVHNYPISGKEALPDYSNLSNWAAHPWKKDLSDSLSDKLRATFKPDSTIDVFFVHPTTLTAGNDSSWNASLQDAELNAKTDYSSILYQASVLNEYRVFAPRYRQAHLRAYYTSDSIAAKEAFDTAYADVERSFQTYLDLYNDGRPIIIVSHSQGTTHALRLLNAYFDTEDMKKKLVVAYVTGMYIPGNNVMSVPACEDSTQTGCLCGWRTYQKGFIPEDMHKEKEGGIVTNPLSWTRSTSYAPNSLSSGSILRDYSKYYTELVDAQIKGGILWISKPRFPGSFLMKMKNYHIGDINLFYNNIRENAKTRVNAYNSRP